MANDRRRRGKRGNNGARSTEEIVRDKIAAMLENVRSARDIDALNATRAEFRKAVPFHLRAYVAAALLLDAAGAGRSQQPQPGQATSQKSPQGKGRGGQREEPRQRDEDRQKGVDIRFTATSREDRAVRASRKEPRDARDETRGEPRRDSRNESRGERNATPREADDAAERKPRAEFKGESATLFFGMGKRQHLYPRIVFKMLEGAGLDSAKVADVRSFDNYTFVSVDPAYSQQAIDALNGTEFRGRALTVGPARRRDEQPADSGERGSEASGERRPSSESAYESDKDYDELDAEGSPEDSEPPYGRDRAGEADDDFADDIDADNDTIGDDEDADDLGDSDDGDGGSDDGFDAEEKDDDASN